ncbi:hypothetical protein BUALT_Bualt13G0122700 [Buddleja alternifolia]|uniref:Uncharacterized protein n=1 Tax=Buddleja alternifolia TaxID=168488 RepID=A0AAV6WNV4_9LAMI|nr:hypothetical protein BUALT_Bualt13G0122700 [Buddleja alternifolia]
MANAFRYFWGLSLSLSLYLNPSISTSHVYIVYLGHSRGHDPFLTSDYHVRLLTNVFQSKEEAMQAMLYSYKHIFSENIYTKANADTREVISVFKSEILDLHTTRSWDFMGLTLDHNEGTPLQLALGDDIIVGVFDSGVWPESASFNEEPGMGPIPKSWKGKCVYGDEFNPEKACNKKLIGARYYKTGFERRYGKINKTKSPEYVSARDVLAHGTHTASIAVGSRAKNAGLFGFARGTARGGAPRARLAVYKVCWNRNFDGICTEEDVLAAFDEALHDGVHVISASFGKRPPLKAFFQSSSDIGSFHAMQLGVSAIFSAGNNGPDPSLVGNVNPWSICVAASSMDRSFPTKILLDDGSSFMVIYFDFMQCEIFISSIVVESRLKYLPCHGLASNMQGEGLISNHISGTLARATSYFFSGLVTSVQKMNAWTYNSAILLIVFLSRICDTRNWKNISASGKILLCFSTDGSVSSEDAEFVARRANAAALIFVQPLTRPVAALSIIPLVRIDAIQGTKIYLSHNLTKVQIFPSETAFKRSPAPVVSDFSSRGPSSISPDFLKPDISAPGINILAAWPPNVPPSVFPGDGRSVNWNFDSGTSMSCPHVSGVVALLKSAYPHWSPAAIRSALITTAYSTDMSGDGILVESSTKSSDPFDIGGGHINPLNAFDPGLIYDTNTRDYVIFLCNSGYSEEQIRSMVICPVETCTRCPNKLEPNWNVNYPSITISNLNCTTTVKRSVKNVGHVKTAIYFVSVVSPNGVEVVVWPKMLIFSGFKEEVTYFVTLKPLKMSQGRYDFGSITWSDGFHRVRSPLVVQVNNNNNNIGVGSFDETEADSSNIAPY